MSRAQVVTFKGGLNLVDAPLALPPGELLFATNYEPGNRGGYRRIDGYEKYDGRATLADVQAIPGSGPIRGVWIYLGVVYAFRDNSTATQCVMYKSSTAGWTVVATPVLNAGGRYEFVNFNFVGHSAGVKMYGADGRNKAFQFDGTTFTQITSTMTDDRPTHIAAFKNYLFLSFAGGSVQNSSLGDPLAWTPITGATEIAVGEEVSGFQVEVGSTLAIFTRNTTWLLQGETTSDFVLRPYSEETGAIPYTIQRLGKTVYLDDRGVSQIGATQEFGNFANATISRNIQSLIDDNRGLAISSCIVRSKDQYRLFFSNNKGLIYRFGTRDAPGGFTTVDYKLPVRCVVSAEGPDGNEQIYFGSDTGFVYRMDKGTSFAGTAIHALLRLPYYHYGSPRQNKRFRRIELEMAGGVTTSLYVSPDFNYGSRDVPSVVNELYTLAGGGGFWGSTTWSQFTWGGSSVLTAEASIDGIGYNMGLLISSTTATEAPHTLHGMTVSFDYRAGVR